MMIVDRLILTLQRVSLGTIFIFNLVGGKIAPETQWWESMNSIEGSLTLDVAVTIPWGLRAQTEEERVGGGGQINTSSHLSMLPDCGHNMAGHLTLLPPCLPSHNELNPLD